MLHERRALKLLSMVHYTLGGVMAVIVFPFSLIAAENGVKQTVLILWFSILGLAVIFIMLANMIAKKIKAALHISLVVLTTAVLLFGLFALISAAVYAQSRELSTLMVGVIMLGVVPFMLFYFPWRINIKIIKGGYREGRPAESTPFTATSAENTTKAVYQKKHQ